MIIFPTHTTRWRLSTYPFLVKPFVLIKSPCVRLKMYIQNSSARIKRLETNSARIVFKLYLIDRKNKRCAFRKVSTPLRVLKLLTNNHKALQLLIPYFKATTYKNPKGLIHVAGTIHKPTRNNTWLQIMNQTHKE